MDGTGSENFSKHELGLLKNLNKPAKVQDYLNSIKFNFETHGETLRSPVRMMRAGEAHCLEGAIFAAYALSLHGFKPLIVHLKSSKEDYDHVVMVFQIDGLWGAISKTNHAVLRYREPVYKNIRELVMSYFHEYFLNSTGVKTLRSYSVPLDLSVFEKGWEVAEDDLWGIDEELDLIKHYEILPKGMIKKLRKADHIEIKAGSIKEY